ncbi:MAG: alpha/beta hydrolase [Chloroflexi bacterium]|nr:alpha/beta hydrolase [Chloroflexota bacterium]
MKTKPWIIGIALTVVLLGVGPFLVPVPPPEGTTAAENLSDPDSQFVEVGGLKVHLKSAGTGQTALILLHGFGASLFSWREVMLPLSAEFQVLAYDRPGFGLTERPKRSAWTGVNPYSLEAQADLAVQLMDRFGINQAILVGHSAGGTVAMYTALKYPRRVQALILVDPAVYPSGGLPGVARPLFSLPQIDHLGPLLVRSIASRGEDILDNAWHDPGMITPEIVAGYRKPLQVDGWDVGLWEFTRAASYPNLEPRFNELKMPVVVISGDDDRIVPLEQSTRLAQALPDSRLAVIPECGHLPQEEQPAAFLEVVRGFFMEIGIL